MASNLRFSAEILRDIFPLYHRVKNCVNQDRGLLYKNLDFLELTSESSPVKAHQETSTFNHNFYFHNFDVGFNL